MTLKQKNLCVLKCGLSYCADFGWFSKHEFKDTNEENTLYILGCKFWFVFIFLYWIWMSTLFSKVSNLFARDEIDEINSDLISVMKKEYPRRPPTNENLYDYFMSRVRQNLHIVLCFSPVGEKFRNRALKFPALISGCTIDWFSRWPKDALVAG